MRRDASYQGTTSVVPIAALLRVILSGGPRLLLRTGVEGSAVRPQREGLSTPPGAPGLATFETRVRQDPSLWESRQIQKLQFLYIP